MTSVVDVTPNQHFTEPPPRFTEATLIKALEEHGIGRPSTYAATISTIVDRGYVRVEERRLHPRRSARSSPTSSWRTSATTWTSRSRPGMEEDLDEVAERRARVGAAAAGVLRRRSRIASTRSARPSAQRRHDRAHRRGLLAKATRWSSASGATAKFLACSTYPEHKETRPLPGDEAPKLEGDGDPCPQCGEGVLTTQARPVRGLRRLLALPGLHLHPQGRPAAARPARRSRSSAPRTATASSWRVAPGGPATSSGGAPATRAATSRRTSSRPVRSTTPTRTARGAIARRPDGGLCLTCGATVELPEGDLVGRRLAGGPPDPAALQRPARGGGRRGRWSRTGRRRPTREPERGHLAVRSRDAALRRVTPARRSGASPERWLLTMANG